MNDERLKLLIVGAFPPPGRAVFGGMVTSCRMLVQSSLPTRAELTLIDSTQTAHPPPPRLVRARLALRRMRLYIAALRSRRPDAVILFVAAGMSVADKGAMSWYARLHGVPVLMFPRGGPVLEACRRSWMIRVAVRCAFGGARTILCQGEAWRRFAMETLGRAPNDAPLVPNWTAGPELLALGRGRTARSGALRVLFVGWLDRTKGVAELLDAWRQLAPAATLRFAGEGDMSTAARRFVAENGLAARVEFLGWLDPGRLLEEYEAADIFVLPSWSEGLPNAMIEAMASGLPVIVTTVGNIPAVLTDGRNALLIPPRDVSALQRALARLLADAELRQSLGHSAQELAASEFGVEAAVERILSAARHAQRARQPVGRGQGTRWGSG
jgi:glycosyltransferase involved in cell wall biosynthesis